MFQFSDQTTRDRYIAQVYVDLALKTTVNSIFKNDQSIKKGENTIQEEVAPKVGGWREYTDLTDPRLIASKKQLVDNFPTLANYKLLRVESQVVSGINFRFFFEDQTTK